MFFLLVLRDSTGRMLLDDSLPLFPPSLEGLDPTVTGFRISMKEDLGLAGDLTFLVPEPTTFLLISFGTFGLIRRRRRRSQPNLNPAGARKMRSRASVLASIAVALCSIYGLPAYGITDCQPNGIDDPCDIDCGPPGGPCEVSGCGTSGDCNQNGIPDDCDIVTCPPIQVVFLFDTSGSITTTKLRALCDAAVADLLAEGKQVSAEFLRIGDGGESGCDCCTSNIRVQYCPPTPPPGSLCDELGSGCVGGDSEDWASAVAVVAQNKSWTAGFGLREIIPMVDEGPRCGDPVNDPGDDRDAIENAIPIVQSNFVTVSPVVVASDNPPDELDPDVVTLAARLAEETGGRVLFDDEDPRSEIADVLRLSCSIHVADCNGNGIPDWCDIRDGVSQDCRAQNDCCTVHGSPGCSDPGISACVCGIDITCCTAIWTQTCVDHATSSCGCDAPDGVPDECQPQDCQSNGINDSCDISCGPPGAPCNVSGCGLSTDCNANCVPDECAPVNDCNDNGIEDCADIDNGTSCDGDNNEIPDECVACCEGQFPNITCTNRLPSDCPLPPNGNVHMEATCVECTCVPVDCCDGSPCTPSLDCDCMGRTDHISLPFTGCGNSLCGTGVCCHDSGACLEPPCGLGETFIGGADCNSNPCPLPECVVDSDCTSGLICCATAHTSCHRGSQLIVA